MTKRSKPEESFRYIVIGGGNAAGYVADAFVKNGLKAGELLIISDEKEVSMERPTLSKAYLFPKDAARLPAFHTTAGGGGKPHDKAWYKEQGIEFRTGTNVAAVDVKNRTVSIEAGDKIPFEKLIIALGSVAIDMSKADGGKLANIFSLRNIADADALLKGIESAKTAGKKAVVVGAGYIGLEVGSCLAKHGLEVTIVMPGDKFMPRLFTTEIAEFYEKFYADKGVKVIKNEKVTAFEGEGKVQKAVLKSGSKLDCDLAVIGIGAKPNVELFEGQLELLDDKPGGIKVDSNLQTSEEGVFAIGDVAAFPLKQYGDVITRQEHVAHARQSAAHVVSHLLHPGNTAAYDYFPFFYSRVWTLAWQFYGDNSEVDETTFFGSTDLEKPKFGTYFIKKGKIIGVFLESGSDAENAAAKKVAMQQPAAPSDLGKQGLAFITSF